MMGGWGVSLRLGFGRYCLGILTVADGCRFVCGEGEGLRER